MYMLHAMLTGKESLHPSLHVITTLTQASVYGKAFSVFGRELDMMTQDSLRFYKSHAVYPNFGGVVLDREEGRKIAECLGDGKAAILQNHGLITVSATHGNHIYCTQLTRVGRGNN
jgi:ribulose-5-phosphate 4-epimerase/fuculose-1-phosphate aldolase